MRPFLTALSLRSFFPFLTWCIPIGTGSTRRAACWSAPTTRCLIPCFGVRLPAQASGPPYGKARSLSGTRDWLAPEARPAYSAWTGKAGCGRHRQAMKFLKGGEKVLLFPEGTRIKDGGEARPRPGRHAGRAVRRPHPAGLSLRKKSGLAALR